MRKISSRIIAKNKQAKALLKSGLISRFYLREKIGNYYDVVPELDEQIIKKLNISLPMNIGGKGFSIDSALASCAGEAIERISLKSSNHTKKVEMRNFRTNKARLYPEYFIYLSKNVIRRTSVGTAFGTQKVDVIKAALLELIERHTLLAYWYSNKQILEMADYSNKKLVVGFEKRLKITISQYVLSAYKNTSVYLTRINSTSGTIFGSACSENSNVAIEHSLAEALQLYTSLLIVNKKGLKTKNAKQLYSLSRTFPFRISDSKKVVAENFYFDLSKVNFYYADITYPKFSSFGSVMRIYAPQLLEQIPEHGIIPKANYNYINRFDKHGSPPFV